MKNILVTLHRQYVHIKYITQGYTRYRYDKTIFQNMIREAEDTTIHNLIAKYLEIIKCFI